jgi:hypothetical protein
LYKADGRLSLHVSYSSPFLRASPIVLREKERNVTVSPIGTKSVTGVGPYSASNRDPDEHVQFWSTLDSDHIMNISLIRKFFFLISMQSAWFNILVIFCQK